METVRAFIAIELPDSVKAVLSGLQERLRRGGPAPVKWVEPDGMHLTVKFLGNVAAPAIPDIERVIADSAQNIHPFRLSLGQPGAFPNLRAPRVVWVGIEGDTATLASLQESLERGILPLGFEKEKRAFSAHLTLGRVRDKASAAETRRLGDMLASPAPLDPVAFDVNSVSLMRSTLTRERAIYDRLYEAALGRGRNEYVVKRQ
jgi:2'-5' RNA ligase